MDPKVKSSLCNQIQITLSDSGQGQGKKKARTITEFFINAQGLDGFLLLQYSIVFKN